jgi:hypothetical protein
VEQRLGVLEALVGGFIVPELLKRPIIEGASQLHEVTCEGGETGDWAVTLTKEGAVAYIDVRKV